MMAKGNVNMEEISCTGEMMIKDDVAEVARIFFFEWQKPFPRHST